LFFAELILNGDKEASSCLRMLCS